MVCWKRLSTGPGAPPEKVRPAETAAVPDVSGALRGASLRGAWRLARRVREASWSTATIVRVDGDPAAAVPALLTAAARAGYQDVISPWSPDPDAPPETVHRVYSQRLRSVTVE